MNLKPITMGCLLALCSSAYPDNNHAHSSQGSPSDAASTVQARYAGSCEIEIINRSFEDVHVSGFFDDGEPLRGFTVYSYGSPQYIPLFYYGYCHYGMDLYIDSYNGYPIYSAYTQRESTIRIVPYLKERVTAEIAKR